MKKIFITCLVLFAAVHAQAAEQALLDKAKAEGKAAFYANITAVEPIMKAFADDTA
jgi:iron(III) transport system substrate-binding protein